ncbi:MAG: hypothetical protein KKG99_12275 [Bacteroidetes bacterium]|nr:hypothetical protein [Bacteroidota bacterium]
MKSVEVITISGKRGYGKTTLAKNIIGQLSRVAVWDMMAEYNHPNSYIPHRGDMKEFNTWLKGYWNTGNVFILVDEADQVMPEGKPLVEYANKIINLGRHRNIGMGMITRRLANLNKTAVSQSATMYLFHHFIINDIRYLKEMIPDAESLHNLQKFQYKTYNL